MSKGNVVITIGDNAIPEKLLKEKILGRIMKEIEDDEGIWEWVESWVKKEGKKWMKENEVEVKKQLDKKMGELVKEVTKAMDITLEY